MVDVGAWLVKRRGQLDRGEAGWLERLAHFDRHGLWAAEGQLSCVSWLVWRTNMGRSTAFDKLRVAHQLQRRPLLAEAFRQGRLSYSAVRAITRLDSPDPQVDQALIALAESGQASIIDIERVVRSYHLYADQDRPPPDTTTHTRGVKIVRGDDGTGQVTVTLGDLEIEEFAAALQAFVDRRYRPRPGDNSSPRDDLGPHTPSEATLEDSWRPGDQSSRRDGPASHAPGEAALEKPSRAARTADAFMDLVATALRHADHGHAAGDDRYLVHLVTRPDNPAMTTLDGRPLHPGDAAMVACDTSSVAHTITDNGEPLNLGRKTREWNTAQRRAISVRDGGHCRFPGCQHFHYDIHHIQPWEPNGPTNINNGCCQCRRHHRMLHHQYRIQGDPNTELRFYRPDGTHIGSTYPANARQLAGV